MLAAPKHHQDRGFSRASEGYAREIPSAEAIGASIAALAAVQLASIRGHEPEPQAAQGAGVPAAGSAAGSAAEEGGAIMVHAYICVRRARRTAAKAAIEAPMASALGNSRAYPSAARLNPLS